MPSFLLGFLTLFQLWPTALHDASVDAASQPRHRFAVSCFQLDGSVPSLLSFLFLGRGISQEQLFTTRRRSWHKFGTTPFRAPHHGAVDVVALERAPATYL